MVCAIPTGSDWGNAISAYSNAIKFAVAVFIKTLAELSGEQTQARSKVNNDLSVDEGLGCAHAPPSEQIFGNYKNSLNFLVVDKDKRCAAERDSMAGPLFLTSSSSPQMQYFAGQIRTRGGGFKSTWPSAGY